MPTQTFDNVEPIRPGKPFEARIVFPQAFWDAEQMASGVIEADIRATINGPLLVQIRSDEDGIAREPNRTLCLKLTAVETAKLKIYSQVMFDFDRIAPDGSRRALAGRWTWTVLPTVTRANG